MEIQDNEFYFHWWKEMLEIVDKLVIFLCLVAIYLLESAQLFWIFPIILALTISSLNSYFERTAFHMIFFIIYSILCVFFSGFLLFLPLLFYDVILNKHPLIYLFALIPIISNQGYLSNRIIFIIVIHIQNYCVFMVKRYTLLNIFYKTNYNLLI